MADKAFLCGLNPYPGCPLEGCEDDVLDASRFVVDFCGFDPKIIRLLTGLRGTTAAILERLDWLVSDLTAGDRILFWYSGHGASVATRDPAGSVDGLDSCICPIDFDWSDEHMIRDKDLHRIFSQIPEGVQAIFVSDSCHSGSLTRDADGLGGRREKCIRPPADIAWRLEAAQRSGMVLGPRDFPNIALISGCREDQTSADANFGGRANGALSYFLLQELAKPNGTTTPLNVLVPKVISDLQQNSYEQVPQLEGPDPLVTGTFFHK